LQEALKRIGHLTAQIAVDQITACPQLRHLRLQISDLKRKLARISDLKKKLAQIADFRSQKETRVDFRSQKENSRRLQISDLKRKTRADFRSQLKSLSIVDCSCSCFLLLLPAPALMPLLLSLLRQSNFAQQFGKPWIAAQTVVMRVDFEELHLQIVI
jgi:hypothetical protein